MKKFIKITINGKFFLFSLFFMIILSLTTEDSLFLLL
jgi:hypothetical protein